MKNVIKKKKAKEKKRLLENIADITAATELAWVLSSFNLTRKYM